MSQAKFRTVGATANRLSYKNEAAHRPPNVLAARRLEVMLAFSDKRAPIKCPRCGVVFIGGDFAHLDSPLCQLAGATIEEVALPGDESKHG